MKTLLQNSQKSGGQGSVGRCAHLSIDYQVVSLCDLKGCILSQKGGDVLVSPNHPAT